MLQQLCMHGWWQWAHAESHECDPHYVLLIVMSDIIGKSEFWSLLVEYGPKKLIGIYDRGEYYFECPFQYTSDLALKYWLFYY